MRDSMGALREIKRNEEEMENVKEERKFRLEDAEMKDRKRGGKKVRRRGRRNL